MIKESYTPRLDLLIVRRDQAIEQTEGGVFIPRTTQRQMAKGTVTAVGPGRMHNGQRMPVSSDLTPGTRVYFAPSQVIPLEGDDEHVLLPEGAILCTLLQEFDSPFDSPAASSPPGGERSGTAEVGS